MYAVLHNSFVRFLLVGIINTLIGLSVIYLLLNGVHLNYWWSTIVGNTVGAAVSYMMNKRFTFRHNRPMRHSLWKFVLVTFSCYGLSYLSGFYLTAYLLSMYRQNPHLIANAAVLIGSGIYTVSNYAGHKLFTFR